MADPSEAPEQERDTSQNVHVWPQEDQVGPLAAGTIYKVSIGMQVDNNLPRDNMYVMPHIEDMNGASAPSALATQIASNMTSYLGGPYRGQIKVYLEDFNPGATHNPLSTADFGTVGTILGSGTPREIALCLSYYATQNTKRYRGRLYIPHAWLRAPAGGPGTAADARPTATHIAKALSFAPTVLAPVSTLGMRWSVASTVDKVARKVTNYWVDDEWDVQRRRGYRGTTRQTGTMP